MDKLESWQTLARVAARSGDADQMLDEGLGVLAELIGADALVVLRRQGEAWELAHRVGEPLDVEELTAALAAGAEPQDLSPPASWGPVGLMRAQRLPGHAGCLVQVWRGALGRDADLKGPEELMVAGLQRCEAQAQFADLSQRVDSAQALANMGDYDWHIESDTNRWSDQLYRIYGHEPQAFNASYERFLSFIHPDDRERITGLHQNAYATGEPYAMMERIVRPDGEVRYLSSNGQVIMSDGRPVRMRGTCIDVTDQVLAEQERERSAAMFRTLVESSPDAILVMDAAGVVVQANGRAHQLLGGDPVGHDFRAMVPQAQDRPDGAVTGSGVDGRVLLLDVVMADLTGLDEDRADGEVAAFLHDAAPRLQNEALAAAVREGQVRRRQAMEINDNVVQGLSAALYAMRDGLTEPATETLERTLVSARRMMSDLLEPVDGDVVQPGDLVRSAPSSLGGAAT
jgi:PAS domain S-box-containing protein